MSERNQLVAVLLLAMMGLCAMAGAIYLAKGGVDPPSPLVALAGVCVGGLAGFLAQRNGH